MRFSDPADGEARMDAAEDLNQTCRCVSLEPRALTRALEADTGDAALARLVRERCPHVFAAQPVFVTGLQLQRMARVVEAVESVVALPAYRDLVLADAPWVARQGAAVPRGVFLGFDFHVSGDRLSLIEINTNAGGAMLNAVLARAQRSCCPEIQPMVPTEAQATAFERRIVDMFREEWRLATGGGRPLRTVAIVDDEPERQYLYPEFLMFQRLLERHGIRTVVASPGDLACRDGIGQSAGMAIDLVYNRLTDFYLEQPHHAPLLEAWLRRGTVVTPHPRVYALHADKRRLALLSDARQLAALGASDDALRVLSESVPHTEIVSPADGERLWAERRKLFFKPAVGYGSRAAYRGDKLTRRVWQEILGGGYIAQALVAPGERLIEAREGAQEMKFDLRAYVYAGQVQWVGARLYQGQTTNFRAPGGGFAPVYRADHAACGTPARSRP